MTRVYIYTITLKPDTDGDPIVLKSRHLHLLVEAVNKYTERNKIADNSNIQRLQNTRKYTMSHTRQRGYRLRLDIECLIFVFVIGQY